MINPVMQFLYQWTLNDPIRGAQNDGDGDIKYIYRSTKIAEAFSAEEFWCIDVYAGNGTSSRISQTMDTKEVNDFISKYTI